MDGVKELLEDLRTFSTAQLSDALGRRCATGGLLALWDERRCGRLCGIARTVTVPAGENLAIHRTLSSIEPGEVLVVAAEGSTQRAVGGELLARALQNRGATGMVIDGAVRDSSALRELDWPVLARGVSPLGPGKLPVGEAGVTAQINDLLVSEGDVVLGDSDGLVAFALPTLSKVLTEVAAVRDKEDRWAQEIDEGRWDPGF